MSIILAKSGRNLSKFIKIALTFLVFNIFCSNFNSDQVSAETSISGAFLGARAPLGVPPWPPSTPTRTGTLYYAEFMLGPRIRIISRLPAHTVLAQGRKLSVHEKRVKLMRSAVVFDKCKAF